MKSGTFEDFYRDLLLSLDLPVEIRQAEPLPSVEPVRPYPAENWKDEKPQPGEIPMAEWYAREMKQTGLQLSTIRSRLNSHPETYYPKIEIVKRGSRRFVKV